MSDIAVVGGYYGEHCVAPAVNERYGSGGRAALAIARAGKAVAWHYYCPETEMDDVQLVLADLNLQHHPSPSETRVDFRYFHPLSRPEYFPAKILSAPPIVVKARNALRFGFMEGDAVVQAETCVYDPQSPEAVPFGSNGSQAKLLAVVLNANEVRRYGAAADETSAIQAMFQDVMVAVVLVKAGAEGCRVYEAGRFVGTIAPFWSERVYKIGTGDVFSASFAYNWMLLGRSPMDAAETASQCVAHYASTRTPVVDQAEVVPGLLPVEARNKGRVYIAGPFFTMSELWLVEEAVRAFHELGTAAFSPYHDVGLGKADVVVKNDLAALDASTAVFAILDGCDPGTMFEVGYATRTGMPVVALAQNPKRSDLTMLEGSPSCSITNDFATAVYRAVWAACR